MSFALPQQSRNPLPFALTIPGAENVADCPVGGGLLAASDRFSLGHSSLGPARTLDSFSYLADSQAEPLGKKRLQQDRNLSLRRVLGSVATTSYRSVEIQEAPPEIRATSTPYAFPTRSASVTKSL